MAPARPRPIAGSTSPAALEPVDEAADEEAVPEEEPAEPADPAEPVLLELEPEEVLEAPVGLPVVTTVPLEPEPDPAPPVPTTTWEPVPTAPPAGTVTAVGMEEPMPGPVRMGVG